MARYAGADCRMCRREKMKLFLKGSKCESPKCPIEIRPYPPGEHGRGRSKDSEYLLQLREKQKARRIYGVLEKQFRGYYEEAVAKPGKTGEVLLQILESRLDNVVYRAGYAQSRDMARRAAASAASCAANGVDLREPLKPTWPEDAQEMTAPVGSVIDTPVQEQLIVELYSK